MEKGEEEEISNDITVGFNLFIIFGNNKARKKKYIITQIPIGK